MKKRKGWSAKKVAGGGTNSGDTKGTTTVAAAASVPVSVTSTKALWMTSDTCRSLPRYIPVSKGREMENVLNT